MSSAGSPFDERDGDLTHIDIEDEYNNNSDATLNFPSSRGSQNAERVSVGQEHSSKDESSHSQSSRREHDSSPQPLRRRPRPYLAEQEAERLIPISQESRGYVEDTQIDLSQRRSSRRSSQAEDEYYNIREDPRATDGLAYRDQAYHDQAHHYDQARPAAAATTTAIETVAEPVDQNNGTQDPAPNKRHKSLTHDSRIHEAVTEVVGVTPARVFRLTYSSLKDSLQELTQRSYIYYLTKYRQRVATPDPAVESDLHHQFRVLLKAVQKNFDLFSDDMEHKMLKQILNLDRDLFDQGYIRFSHHDNIDYEHLDSVRSIRSKFDSVSNGLHKLSVRAKKIEDERMRLSEAQVSLDKLKAELRSLTTPGQYQDWHRFTEVSLRLELAAHTFMRENDDIKNLPAEYLKDGR